MMNIYPLIKRPAGLENIRDNNFSVSAVEVCILYFLKYTCTYESKLYTTLRMDMTYFILTHLYMHAHALTVPFCSSVRIFL